MAFLGIFTGKLPQWNILLWSNYPSGYACILAHGYARGAQMDTIVRCTMSRYDRPSKLPRMHVMVPRSLRLLLTAREATLSGMRYLMAMENVAVLFAQRNQQFQGFGSRCKVADSLLLASVCAAFHLDRHWYPHRIFITSERSRLLQVGSCQPFIGRGIACHHWYLRSAAAW